MKDKDILEIQKEITEFVNKKGIPLLPSTYKKLFIRNAKKKGFSEEDCLRVDKELAFEELALKASAMKDSKVKDIASKIRDTKENLIINLDEEKKLLDDSINNIKHDADRGKAELKNKVQKFIDRYAHLMHTIDNIKTNINKMEDSIKHASEMGIQDPLTLLGNCKYFEMSFEGELYTLKRYKAPTSLIILRMNNLGQIKEKYGTGVERSVIKHIAAIISDNVRSSDMLFRCENGDFRILLHNTDLEKCQIFAQKIKFIIGRIVFQKGNERFKVNVLYGAAQIREKDTIDSLLMRINLKI